LHDSVEGDECVYYDFSHLIIPLGSVPHTIPACTISSLSSGVTAN
jgi:hypothetical protein